MGIHLLTAGTLEPSYGLVFNRKVLEAQHEVKEDRIPDADALLVHLPPLKEERRVDGKKLAVDGGVLGISPFHLRRFQNTIRPPAVLLFSFFFDLEVEKEKERRDHMTGVLV